MKKGYWEQEGKNPLIAAFAGSLIVLAIYFFVSQIMLLAIIFSSFGKLNFDDGNFLADIYSQFRVPILLVTAIMQLLLFGLFTAFLFRKWHGVDLKERFRIVRPPVKASLLALLGMLGLLPLAILGGEIFPRVFPQIQELLEGNSAFFSAETSLERALLYLVICIVPALFEEFHFRGYFQSTLGRGLKRPWLWLVAGSWFALIHQNHLGIVALLIIGLYIAWVYEITRSIWAGVIIHCLYNALILSINFYPAAFGFAFDSSGFIKPMVAVAGGLSSALCILLLKFEERQRVRKYSA